MKKFQLSSNKTNGIITIVYDDRDMLCCIDWMEAQLSKAQITFLLKNISVSFSDLEAFILGHNMNCIEVGVDISFDQFWDKYGYKVDKKRAKAIWDKMSVQKRLAAYHGIAKYERHLKMAEWRNKMEAKSYLKNERWEDEWR